jgi:YqaJ-like viral recombinase domain
LTRDKLTKIIEKHQETIEDEARNYIGASSIGSDCLRQIWYSYKGTKAENVPSKMRRTWAIGKRLEGLILDWLEESGFDIDTEGGTLQSSHVKEFRGHLDSVLIVNGAENSIVEIKTAKHASFNVFVAKGLKIWNPQYYAQLQSYMGMSGIFSAYLLVLNKDNSDLSDELVLFDEEFYLKLEAKALMISTAVVAPPRIHGSPLWYQCKMCKFNKVCHT